MLIVGAHNPKRRGVRRISLAESGSAAWWLLAELGLLVVLAGVLLLRRRGARRQVTSHQLPVALNSPTGGGAE